MTKKMRLSRTRIPIRKICKADLRDVLHVHNILVHNNLEFHGKVLAHPRSLVLILHHDKFPDSSQLMLPVYQRACACQTVPNLYNPNAATRERPIGNGFCILIACQKRQFNAVRLAIANAETT